MLQANWADGKSYLGNFRPFVEECIRTLDRPFTSAEIRRSVKDCFGVELPHAAIETLLKRLAKDGVLDHEGGPRRQRRWVLENLPGKAEDNVHPVAAERIDLRSDL